MNKRLNYLCAAMVLLLVLVAPAAVAAAGTWTLSNQFPIQHLEDAQTSSGEIVAQGSYVPSGTSGGVTTLKVPGSGISLRFRHGWTVPPGTLTAGSSVTTRLSVSDDGSSVPSSQQKYVTSENEGATAIDGGVADDKGMLDRAQSLTADQLDDLISSIDVSEGVSIAPGNSPQTKDATWTVPDGKAGSHLVLILGGKARSVARYNVQGGSYLPTQPEISGGTVLVYKYSEEPVTGDIPWLPVVGGLALVAAAAAIIAKGLGKKKPGEQKSVEKEKKDEGPAGYILQITPSDTIDVSTKKSGGFTATVWKVDRAGATTHAAGVPVRITPPPGIPGLTVAPLSGTGSVAVTVSLAKPAPVDSARIQVSAAAGGGGTSANVTVNFESETEIEFD
jgi:hypothetical protein